MVRCSDCGFLALRSREDGALVEADAEYRRRGVVFVQRGARFESTERLPRCFVQRRDFVAGYSYDPETVAAISIQVLIAEELECGPDATRLGFTQWIQGHTPKEHREMLDRHRLLEMDTAREADRRRFEIGLTARTTAPQWWLVGVGVFTFCLALASVVVSIVALVH